MNLQQTVGPTDMPSGFVTTPEWRLLVARGALSGKRRLGAGIVIRERRKTLEITVRAPASSTATRCDYHGILVAEGLGDRSVLDTATVLGTKRGRDWTLLRVAVAEERLSTVIVRIQQSLRVEGGVPFYAHFYRARELIVVFPDRVFRLTPQKESWGPAVAYGRSVGIPRAQRDFNPRRFEDEAY